MNLGLILFGLLITILMYYLSLRIYLKTKLSIFNPILLSICFIIICLLILNIDYETYMIGSHYISDLLGPIVVMLAIPLYKNKDALVRHRMPIFIGLITSILVCFVSIGLFHIIFSFESEILLSLLPKSITTALALEVANMIGGNPSIVIVFVILTGVIGNTIAYSVMRIGKIESHIAMGIGIGASSHGVGTAKAMEISKEAGAMSGLAMSVVGIMMVLGATLFT